MGSSGFGRLVEVKGSVHINRTKELETIPGFDKLNLLGDLRISGNDKLQSIRGFSSLVEVKRSLHIQKNKELKTIRTFDRLNILGHSLRINDNPKLQSIAGFRSLVEVEEFILIQSRTGPKTTPINLHRPGTLLIAGNGKLQSITGFSLG